MDNQTKQCQNCEASFEIDASDFEFYEKINVPAPTFCPECRLIRRMMFRNDKVLYKRKSNYSNKEIFSMFSSKSPVKVYEREIWWSDIWNPLDYGGDYNFSKSFFEQWYNLLQEVLVSEFEY